MNEIRARVISQEKGDELYENDRVHKTGSGF